jgi:hypothetical protein
MGGIHHGERIEDGELILCGSLVYSVVLCDLLIFSKEQQFSKFLVLFSHYENEKPFSTLFTYIL